MSRNTGVPSSHNCIPIKTYKKLHKFNVQNIEIIEVKQMKNSILKNSNFQIFREKKYLKKTVPAKPGIQ